MDGRMLVRLAALLFVIVAIAATVIETSRKENEVAAPQLVRPSEPSRDPLREGLQRCQQLGEPAAGNAECLRLWAESRDRFLGKAATPPAPAPIEER